jgi:hypothetical protein
MAEETRSPGGSTIHRYSDPSRTGWPDPDQQFFADEIARHLDQLLGPPDGYFVEFISQVISIGIFQYRPTAERKFWTFVTSGMSSLPMPVPKEIPNPQNFERAELLIAVSEDWLSKNSVGLSGKDFGRPEKWWPIAKLKEFARFPHAYGAWFWEEHTLANYDPPEPLGPGTRQDGVVLLPPATLPREACVIEAGPGVRITLFALIPLYPEEMKLKLERGIGTLRQLLEEAGVDEVVAPKRRNVALQN